MSRLKEDINFLINHRLREIREDLGIRREEFATMLGIGYQTVVNIESERNKPSCDVLEAAAEKWPWYAYWLITGMTDAGHDHHSPQSRKENNIRINIGGKPIPLGDAPLKAKPKKFNTRD